PRDIAVMVVLNKHFPLVPPARHAAGDHLAPTLEPNPGAGAPENIGAGIDRIGQQPMDCIVARQAPMHDSYLRAVHDYRQGDTLLPEPQGELADAADLTELAEYQRQRLANPQIRVLLQAVVGTAAVADRDGRVKLAARCLQAKRLLG